ncbi:MAG: glycosyltransferase family protein [Armatimonadota bacterium]
MAATGPDIRLPNGMAQNPFLETRLTAAWIQHYTRIFNSDLAFLAWETGYHLKRNIRRCFVPEKSAATSPRAIYAPYGAAMFFRKSFFSQGGTLKFRAFMYQEEIFIAEQLRVLGLSCMFVPGLQITHYESTTMKLVDARIRRSFKLASARAVYEDYFADR